MLTRMSRTIHMPKACAFGPIGGFAPDLEIRVDGDVEPGALMLTDPDGEVHIFLFSEEGRLELAKQLTGGLILPGPPTVQL